MANTTFNARLALRYDTYTNWANANPVLMQGEVAVVVVPASTGAVTQEPAVLFKVGDGKTSYSALPFVSGLAANIYDWAKAATKPSYNASEIVDLESFISGKVEDTNTTYKVETDSTNARKFYLYAQEKGSSSWTQVSAVEIPEQTDYAVTVSTSNPDGVAKRYTVQQAATGLNVTIDIPKDMVVSSGTVETKTASGAWGDAGTYLHLVLANADNSDIYINVGNLIEYVTSGSSEGDQIMVSVSADHKVTATLTNGSVTLAQLHSDVQSAIGQAHTHGNKNVLDGITAEKTAAWDGKADADHTHKIEDLSQTDYIILGGGSATGF